MPYTAQGLVEYARGWLNCTTRYGWGCFGQPISESVIQYKSSQYPSHYNAARKSELRGLIGKGWLIDCVGLIKSYYWGCTPGGTEAPYPVGGHGDVDANNMYNRATVKGPILTMPETPGLCVQMDGHIGIYIGNGQVIESTRSSFGDGVCQTNIWDRQWLHWLQCPYIDYSHVDYSESVGDIDVIVPVNLPDQAVNINGKAVPGAVLLLVEGKETAYIPARALRDAGQAVTWDAVNNVVNITIE